MERNYFNSSDYQTSVLFSFSEGERARAEDNNWLGEFKLSPITAAPRGVTKMKVCFEIDANGILNVSAVEQTTGVNCKITVTNYKARRSKEEINRMVQDANKYKIEDDMYKKTVKATKALEKMAKDLKEFQNELDAARKKKIKLV
jgi:heat shock protein 1/8